MPTITQVQLHLPAKDQYFTELFIQFLSPVGHTAASGIDLAVSNKDYLPRTSFVFEGIEQPFALFRFDAGEPLKAGIANTTGMSKQSPYRYSHITLADFVGRMQAYPLTGLDHTGFNLPYFDGIHPKVLELRQALKNACLYHTFPKHLEDAPWDFIIPATKEETHGSKVVDYSLVRKPKFEIVSFASSSTPLIQIDIQIQGKYEEMAKAFPEALKDPKLRNMWVYIDNSFGIDICFVLNELSDGDWSYEFRNDRLQ